MKYCIDKKLCKNYFHFPDMIIRIPNASILLNITAIVRSISS
jgi:hypothetical protein